MASLNDLLKIKGDKTDNEKAKGAGAITVNKNAPAANGFSVPERIWNFLTQEKGVSSIVTAAIMGNIFQESTYNPNAYNDDAMKAGRASNAAVGICQWLEGRHTALDKVAAAKGKQWNDLEVQLEHLWNEIGPGGYYNQFLNHMTKTYTQESQLDEAVEYWEKHFEVSNDVNSYPRRKAAAREALQKQGKGIIACGTYAPGNNPANGFIGQSSTAKRGTTQERIGVEKTGHRDEWLVKPQDPDKTFCEPIYPDLTSIGEEIPRYSIPNNIPTSDMKLVDYKTVGAGLVYEIPTSVLIKYSNNKDLAQFTVKNEAIANQRKKLFEKAKNRAAFKSPTAGKPPNNLDPFPVDHKIVELETHQPRCKIDSLKACQHSLEATKAVILLSTDTEKRLVRIENNMATMMRYLYRMAARVNINCVYYGGQIPNTYPVKGPNGENNKYCAIRCLKDDRIQEGKQVSLDQCLNCTRYEPLIGQVYDILSDSGDNLSAILDDNQMSYTTMDEYYKFRNLSERQEPMEAADLMASDVGERNISEISLDEEWGPGLAMDWSLFPVELQRPHTNPPAEGALASSFGANGGAAITNGGIVANMLIEARNQIDASDSKAKQTGANYAQEKTDSIVSEMKAKLGSQIREYYSSKNITSGQDQCLIASLMSVYGGQVGETIDKFEKVKNDIKGKGVDNIVLHVMFYSLDQKYLFGDENKDKLPMRLDEVKNKNNSSTEPTENQNQQNQVSGTTDTASWANVSKWNWNEISQPLTINITGKDDTSDIPNQMLNFVKVVYLYKELLAKCSASRFDTAEWGFPFDEETIMASNAGLNTALRTMYFQNTERGRWHNGVDIGVGAGNGDKGNFAGQSKLPIRAVRDGIVVAAYGVDGNGGGIRVCLQHDGGYYSWYMHMSSMAVKQGDKVNRGQIVGYTGGSGWTTMADYEEHLHLEIHSPSNNGWVGTTEAYGWPDDPLKYFAGNLANTFPIYYAQINP